MNLSFINTSMDDSVNMNLANGYEELLVIPEFLSLGFLLLAVIGMHCRIEITHPLYSVIYADLIVPTVLSMANIIGFVLMPQFGYFTLANTNNTIGLFFHCTSWCVTSMIRYSYIVEPERLHKLVPNMKYQCFLALVLTITFSFCLTLPMIGYGLFIGNFILI